MRPRAIGGRVTQFPDVETARRVQVDFPIAALKAFLAELAPPLAAAGKKFRFVFCSGMYAEWDQRKTLAFMQDTRRIKVFTHCNLKNHKAQRLAPRMTYLRV